MHQGGEAFGEGLPRQHRSQIRINVTFTLTTPLDPQRPTAAEGRHGCPQSFSHDAARTWRNMSAEGSALWLPMNPHQGGLSDTRVRVRLILTLTEEIALKGHDS